MAKFIDPDEQQPASSFKDPDASAPMSQDEAAEAFFQQTLNQGFGTGVPEFFYNLGGSATDLAARAGASPEVAAGVGYAANLLPQIATSFLGSGRQINAPQVRQSFIEKAITFPARKLMQSALKPGLRTGPEGQAAVRTMLAERIKPTPGGMEKAAKITEKLDDQIDALIASSKAKVPVGKVADLRSVYKDAVKQAAAKSDMAAVRAVRDDFLDNPLIKGKTEIPAKLAHEMKRGTYRSLGQKVFGELQGRSVEAQKKLAHNMREEVLKAIPKTKPLMERQSAIMNVREIAEDRALAQANKDIFGLASLRLDDPRLAAIFMADRLAWPKAFLALQLATGAAPQTLLPLALTAPRAEGPALMERLGGILSQP